MCIRELKKQCYQFGNSTTYTMTTTTTSTTTAQCPNTRIIMDNLHDAHVPLRAEVHIN